MSFRFLNLSLGLRPGGGASSTFDPEAGLTLTDSFAVGTTLIDSVLTEPPAAGDVNRVRPAIFAADFTGLDGAAGGTGGRLFEIGGSGTGHYIGFRANGDFIARTGNGEAIPGVNNKAWVLLSTGQPSGSGTLVWAINRLSAGPGIRVWWGGTLIGSGNWLVGDATQWTGNDVGGYLTASVQGTQPAEEVTTGLVQGTHYATASALRYYYNQTIA